MGWLVLEVEACWQPTANGTNVENNVLESEPIGDVMMQLRVTIVIIAALLAGCSDTDEGADEAPGASPIPVASSLAQAPAGGRESTATAGSQDPDKAAAGAGRAAPERDREDLVAGCPGMNPKQRPRGSNCFGIFPEQCGAEIAARHIGDTMTETLALRMEEMAPGGARIIRPMQGVTHDLRHARLNVILDERDRIAEVDCY